MAIVRDALVAMPAREPGDPKTRPALTRAHLARLRVYFTHRRGASGMRDTLDLDLIHVGALAYAPSKFGADGTLALTAYGAQLLAEATQQARAERAPHHEMAARLARWLREQGRITWENIEVRIEDGGAHSYARPDVFSLVATHNEQRIAPTVHEVKVSRADFLAELRRPEKLARCRTIASYLWFAVPEDLVEPGEVPQGYGLLVETQDGSWKPRKRPRKGEVRLSTWCWMNLLLKQADRET